MFILDVRDQHPILIYDPCGTHTPHTLSCWSLLRMVTCAATTYLSTAPLEQARWVVVAVCWVVVVVYLKRFHIAVPCVLSCDGPGHHPYIKIHTERYTVFPF